MTWMIRNSRGRPDALLTFSAGAVAVVLVKTMLSGVVAFGVTFGTMDPGLAGVVLGATLGTYTAKRITVDKANGTVLPPTASTTAPAGLTTRGAVSLVSLFVLLAIGFGICLYAAAHRGSM